MSKLKLTYFDFHGGRGEPARLALSIGGIPFEDDRVAPADWPARKPDTPFGALPVLEVDGQTLAQSNAINRYVGNLTDLYPTDAWQAALCDEVMEAVEDINTKLAATLFLPEQEKKTQRKALVDGPLPLYLARLQQRLEAHGGRYFAADRLTVADLKVFVWIRHLKSGVLDHVPADLPDLRRDETGTQQPARADRADACDRGRNARRYARIRRGTELLPRVPGLPDRLSRGCELRGAVRGGAERYRAVECATRHHPEVLTGPDARVSLHAPAHHARGGARARHLSAQRPRIADPRPLGAEDRSPREPLCGSGATVEESTTACCHRSRRDEYRFSTVATRDSGLFRRSDCRLRAPECEIHPSSGGVPPSQH